eukprot:scaffold2859_cov349-Pavlova_lutheri.AAC.88
MQDIIVYNRGLQSDEFAKLTTSLWNRFYGGQDIMYMCICISQFVWDMAREQDAYFALLNTMSTRFSHLHVGTRNVCCGRF